MTDEIYMQEDEPVITKTKDETDKKCAACGGTMEFDPNSGQLLCPYCGSKEEIKVEQKTFVAEERDFFGAEEGNSCDWGTDTKTVICESCGAKTVYSAKDISNICPYCGSNQVMEAGSAKVMAPGGVIPFSISVKEAAGLFKSWIGKKFFCPKLAKESAKPKSFKGLYAPYWTFDAKTSSDYYGQYGIRRTVRRNGKTVVKTDWYSTRGSYRQNFDDLLICGASDQSQKMLEKMEPYDTTKAVEYKPEYMAGFIAESYTIKVKDAWEMAKSKIAKILWRGIYNKIQNDHHAHDARVLDVQTRYNDVTYKYLLLPVWISSFQYKGKMYQFVINGQTGKVSGKTPISWVKVAFVTIAVVVAVLLISAITEGRF